MNKKDLKAVLLASALGGAAFVAPVIMKIMVYTSFL